MGEQSVKFFQQYVWQFQRGLFHDTPTSTPTGCCSSFLAGSVTETSFLCTYLSIGIPMVPRASQPPFPALLAPSSFDSYLVPSTSSPTLAPSVGKAFIVGPGYGLIPGKTGGQNNRWHYLLPLPKKGSRDHRHSHIDSDLYHLAVDLLLYLPFLLAGYYSV